jgi:SAM-dependent methyltransferase
MSQTMAQTAGGVFDQYARYYDLLYRDKDYAREAGFVVEKLRAHGGSGTDLLELGCGTGRHGVEFARLGYHVTGVDLSEKMVSQAGERASQLPAELERRLQFSTGDVRTVRMGRAFDAAVSLFHVMSYQTGTEDLRAAIKTAAAHLKPGGLFLFDFWYGPAVVADPPVVRIKRLRDESLEVTRIAEPDIRAERNCVIVNYQIFLKDLQTGGLSEVRESHPMRYLFQPELEGLLAESGLKLVDSGGWCSDRPLGVDTWYGYIVGKVVSGRGVQD